MFTLPHTQTPVTYSSSFIFHCNGNVPNECFFLFYSSRAYFHFIFHQNSTLHTFGYHIMYHTRGANERFRNVRVCGVYEFKLSNNKITSDENIQNGNFLFYIKRIDSILGFCIGLLINFNVCRCKFEYNSWTERNYTK